MSRIAALGGMGEQQDVVEVTAGAVELTWPDRWDVADLSIMVRPGGGMLVRRESSSSGPRFALLLCRVRQRETR